MDESGDTHGGSPVEAINSTLSRLEFLGESLLLDVRWRHFGYSIDLVFNYVWNGKGSIRPDAETAPWLVTIRLGGVEKLTMSGGLTDAMKAEPDAINWELSEVAGVAAEWCDVHEGEGVKVIVSWESQRSLCVTAVSSSVELSTHVAALVSRG